MTTRAERVLAAAVSEAELQQAVADLARMLGVLHFHVRNSRGMPAGWPDSVLVGQRVIFRELKSARGVLSPAQKAVGQALARAGADWSVWRPADLLSGRIEREIRLLAEPPRLPFTP